MKKSQSTGDGGSELEGSSGDLANGPVLPGTEKPRSLGDVMIEAERQAQSGNAVIAAGQSSKPVRRKKPGRPQARRHARERALQALYQWDVTGADSSAIRLEFLQNQDMSRVDVDFFSVIFSGVSHKPGAVDDLIQPCLDRPLQDLDPVERAVLRIATFELTQQLDIPARVIINESIEITKRFGADKGHRYVNGVLDKLASELRPLEMNNGK